MKISLKWIHEFVNIEEYFLRPNELAEKLTRAGLEVEEIINKAKELNCGICTQQDFVYIYNGQYWRQLEKEELAAFLGAGLAAFTGFLATGLAAFLAAGLTTFFFVAILH